MEAKSVSNWKKKDESAGGWLCMNQSMAAAAAAMFSILRRSYGGGSSSSSIIIPKFAHHRHRRLISISSTYDDGAFPHNVNLKAVYMFELLIQLRVAPISEYNSIFSSLAQVGSSVAVLSLYNQLEQSSQFNRRAVVPDVNTWAILILCHSRRGNISSAISLLHKIIDTGHLPTTQTLNDILDGFIRRQQVQQAMLFYNDIRRTKCVIFDYYSYLILIPELCFIGETQMAIDLFRHDALQIDKEPSKYGFGDFCLMSCLHAILFRLCKDRLLSQAYDLCSELFHVKNIKPDRITYHNLIYGNCIISQFKQALILKQQMDTSKSILYPDPHTLLSTPAATSLVTEQDVKSAKTAAAVMIKCGVKPIAASYHSVFAKLYKGRSTSVVMNKIAQKVQELLIAQHHFKPIALNSTYPDGQF